MTYFGALLFLPALASAGTVFDGYEAYYATLPGQLFHGKNIDLQPYSLRGDKGVRFGWSGSVENHRHMIEIRNGMLAVDGHVLNPKSANTFPGEEVNAGDLGRGSTVYFAHAWVCVENIPQSSSGTAVRHKAVYLVQLANPKPQTWKLPGLFQACRGIREQASRTIFDKVEYRYQAEQDDPTGVLFKEYIIQGNSFISSGRSRSVSFTESGNVYKFSMDQP